MKIQCQNLWDAAKAILKRQFIALKHIFIMLTWEK